MAERPVVAGLDTRGPDEPTEARDRGELPRLRVAAELGRESCVVPRLGREEGREYDDGLRETEGRLALGDTERLIDGLRL